MNNKGMILSLATMLSMLATGVWAQTVSGSTGPNNVYIEQVGNTNTITIEQVGGTNAIGGTNSTTAVGMDPASSSNYGTITGSSNVVTMTQTGTGNVAGYNIRGNNNQYTSTVTGNTNKTTLNIGDANNAVNLRNNITETVTGDTNTLVTAVIGNDIVSAISITGNTNAINSELKSTNGKSNVSISGGNNKLDIQQTDGAGINGHLLTQAIVGDSNAIVTQQQGSNDTTINISTIGSNNTVTVRTSSSSISSPLLAAPR
jgi:hypothetical protein